jgi:hypothetical protein
VARPIHDTQQDVELDAPKRDVRITHMRAAEVAE